MLPVIPSPITFLHVDQELIFADPMELGKARFRETPEALDAVDA